ERARPAAPVVEQAERVDGRRVRFDEYIGRALDPPLIRQPDLVAPVARLREPRDTARVQRLPRRAPVPALLILGEPPEQVHPPAVREAGREDAVPIHAGARPGLRLRAAGEATPRRPRDRRPIA